MHVALTPTNRAYRTTKSNVYRLWILKHWKKVNGEVLRAFRNVPNLSSWLCIHRFEGSWQDDGYPHWGGLQMDLTFQSHYGSYLLRKRGTANHWSPLEQLWTAEYARRSGRGFYPWPNTARMCGLI